MSKRFRGDSDFDADNLRSNLLSHYNNTSKKLAERTHNVESHRAVEGHKDIVNIRKTPQSIITEYTLDSAHLVADSYNASKNYHQNDTRSLNTSANMTFVLATPIPVDHDNYAWDVALGQASSIPNANYNITAAIGNNTFTYSYHSIPNTFDTSGTTFTLADGHKSIIDIYNEIKEHLIDVSRVRGTVSAPEYPIQFTTDQTTGKTTIKCAHETGATLFDMAITITPGLNGYARGIMGVLGYVGATGLPTDTPVGDASPIEFPIVGSEPAFDQYIPIKEININYGVTSYYINCNIAKGTVDSRGTVSTIKTFIWQADFGSRMDFTNAGDQRFCALDPSLDRITEIKVWVTDNLNNQLDWRTQSSNFNILLRQTKLRGSD